MQRSFIVSIIEFNFKSVKLIANSKQFEHEFWTKLKAIKITDSKLEINEPTSKRGFGSLCAGEGR